MRKHTSLHAALLFIALLFSGSAMGNQSQNDPKAPESAQQPLQLSTELVSLDVAVFDGLGRGVLGLTRDDFEVYEDNVKQEITMFSAGDSPLVVGILLDTSGSMGRDEKLNRARAAALHFVQASLPDDEFFIVNFSSTAEVALEFSSDQAAAEAALSGAKAHGRTSLNDAVYLALQKFRDYKTARRKVILLISDGEDTSSRHSVREITKLAKESEVQVYGVGICGMDLTLSAQNTIRTLADITGGSSFLTMDTSRLVGICNWIAADLHRHYHLGYESTNRARDGKWRKIKVKLTTRDTRSSAVVRTRQGYYAPRD